MNLDFHKEVESSFVLKTYNNISKLAKFIPYFKWIAGILFTIGFLETVFFGQPDKLTVWSNVIIWIPGLLFAFIGGTFHFLTGIKLRNMSKKYNMDQTKLQEIVDEILNKK